MLDHLSGFAWCIPDALYLLPINFTFIFMSNTAVSLKVLVLELAAQKEPPAILNF